MSLDAIYIFDYKIFFVINNVFKIKTWNMLPMCSSKIYFSVLRAKGIQTLNFVVALFNDHSYIYGVVYMWSRVLLIFSKVSLSYSSML